jgi:DNA-binding XRE family transcriptional regulator
MTGADVKRARKRLRMSQAELAEAIGMQRNSVARMERDAQRVMRTTELALKYLLLTMEKTKGRK